MGYDKSFHAQDVIHSIINTGSISNSTIIQISAAVKSSFGFELYTLDYFKDHKSKDKDFEDWKNGFPFEIEAIKEKKEFRRNEVIEEIKTKLESKRNLLIVGESGTSKSTVLKEVMCDYLDQGSWVLYNYGTETYNSDVLIKFIEGLLKSGNKILVTVDNAHNANSAAVFYVMDQLSRYQANQNLRFILSARLPDFDNFVGRELGRVQETYRQSIRKFTCKSTADPDFRYELPQFSKKDIKEFIKKYKPTEEDIEDFSQEIYEDSKGVAIMVKFLVLGQGLEKDVADRYYNYLTVNEDNKAGKIETMLVVSLLELQDFEIKDDLLEKIQLLRFAFLLDRATLYKHSEHWNTIHRKWSLEFFSFMFNIDDKSKLYENKNYTIKAIDLIFGAEDEKAIIALVNSLCDSLRFTGSWPIRLIKPNFSFVIIPLEEVEKKVNSLIKSAPVYLSSQTISELRQIIGSAWRWRASCLAHIKPEEALECFSNAIKINPKDPFSWINKANFLLGQKKHDAVLGCYDEAIEAIPDDYALWYFRASFKAKQGNFEGALSDLEKAINLNEACIETAREDEDYEFIKSDKRFLALVSK
jgi:tetratricopeptide (TPR) repeat protein